MALQRRVHIRFVVNCVHVGTISYKHRADVHFRLPRTRPTLPLDPWFREPRTCPAAASTRSHDAAWKQFFALPVAVEHLLRGFFPEVAALADFDTLQDVSGEWVGDGRRRRADSVWRVGYRDGSKRSLTFILEFQATVDRDMVGRVLGMLGMAHRRAQRAGTPGCGPTAPHLVHRHPRGKAEAGPRRAPRSAWRSPRTARCCP